MNKGEYRSVMVICPFYKKESRFKIVCSGVLPKSSIHLSFGDDKTAKKYKEERCKSDYENCLVCRMLQGKEKN